MKFKNKITMLALASAISLGAVGCGVKENPTDNSTKPKESINENNQQNKSKNSTYNLDKLNKEVLPQIEEILKENGLEIKDSEFDEGKKQPDDIYKLYMDKSKTNVGEINQIDYLSVPNDGIWQLEMVINTNKDMFGENKFKIEDTLFYKLSSLIVNNQEYYSNLNKKINETGSNKEGLKIAGVTNTYDDFKIDVTFTETYMMINISLVN